jgi:hypothetical protein
MKKLIRNSVFETNSSSSHSVSIADETKEFVLDTIYPDQDGVIEIHGGEYGWEWFKHNDAETKASYIAQQFQHNEDVLDRIREVIMEQTGAEEVKFIGLENGYVDHDSVGILDSDKESIKQFIFNKNSWLFGGNDNSTADPTFYHVPEFRDGKQILPRYKYELKIEGLDNTTKFLEYPTEDSLHDGLSALLDDVYLTEHGYFDTDNSLMARIHRDSRLYYTYGYRKKPDIENRTIYFTKDSWHKAREIWQRDFGTNDWSGELGYTKCREIEEELLNQENSPYVKAVKFELIEL